jgi:hypothetical protein
VWPGVLLERIVDGLKNAHADICLESRAGRNENNAAAYSVVPLEVSPFGLPATVTSIRPP